MELKRINVGSDIYKIPGMVNIDIRHEVKPDVVMNTLCTAFRGSIASEVHLGNVMEHIGPEDIPVALKECHRVLVDGGQIIVVSPLVDLAEECLARGECGQPIVDQVKYGEEGYQKHLVQLRRGDIEDYLCAAGFHSCEPLELRGFPYLLVSNTLDPKPDPWQFGVKALK